MADLFGEWVPDEWIQEVFRACEATPQHRYLFLTKNPEKIQRLFGEAMLPENNNFWFGTTATIQNNWKIACTDTNSFLSIEPIHEKIILSEKQLIYIDWVIIGAETGNRKNKVIPHREWIDNIVEQCKQAGVPVFMKNSLIPIIGKENMLREFPWERTV